MKQQFPAGYSEMEMLYGIKCGQQKAFDCLYDAYADALYGIILQEQVNEQGAEKILSASFKFAVQHLECYENTNCKLFTWMVKITLTECARYKSSGTIINNNTG